MFQTNHVCCLTILFASCVTSLIGVQAQDSETAETKIKIGRYTQTAKGVPNLEDSIIASRQKDFDAAMQAMMKLEAASKTADDLFAQDSSKTGIMKKDEPDKNLKFDMNQFKERRDSFTDHYVPLLTVARFVKWESKTKNPQTRKFYHSWGRLKKISPDGTKIQITDPSGEFVVVELSKLDSKANNLIDEIRILLANHDTVHKTLLPEVNEFLADWTVYADAVRVAMEKQKEEELKRQAVLAALEAQERHDIEAELEDRQVRILVPSACKRSWHRQHRELPP